MWICLKHNNILKLRLIRLQLFGAIVTSGKETCGWFFLSMKMVKDQGEGGRGAKGKRKRKSLLVVFAGDGVEHR